MTRHPRVRRPKAIAIVQHHVVMTEKERALWKICNQFLGASRLVVVLSNWRSKYAGRSVNNESVFRVFRPQFVHFLIIQRSWDLLRWFCLLGRPMSSWSLYGRPQQVLRFDYFCKLRLTTSCIGNVGNAHSGSLPWGVSILRSFAHRLILHQV